jgi:DNA replication protein DnaC
MRHRSTTTDAMDSAGGIFKLFAHGGYRMPTREELAKAQAEIDASPEFYRSSDPKVFETQVLIYAFGVARRHDLGHLPRQPHREPTPEEIEAATLQRVIEHDRHQSRWMMGEDSIYANISMWDAAQTQETAVLRFLRDEFNLASGKKNLLLLGGTGSGKTYGAVCWVAQHASYNACYRTAYKISEAVTRRDFEETDLLERARFLVIDDLGCEPEGYRGADFLAYFEDLFASRHQHGRFTLITSNATVAQFATAYGERFISRFEEAGIVFTTGDPDLRNSKEPTP